MCLADSSAGQYENNIKSFRVYWLQTSFKVRTVDECCRSRESNLFPVSSNPYVCGLLGNSSPQDSGETFNEIFLNFIGSQDKMVGNH